MCTGILCAKWIVWGGRIEGLFLGMRRMETVVGGRDCGNGDRGGLDVTMGRWWRVVLLQPQPKGYVCNVL